MTSPHATLTTANGLKPAAVVPKAKAMKRNKQEPVELKIPGPHRKVFTNEVVYFRSIGPYSYVQTMKEVLLVSAKKKDLLPQLPHFICVAHSTFINPAFIKSSHWADKAREISRSEVVMKNGMVFSISRRCHADAMEKITGKKVVRVVNESAYRRALETIALYEQQRAVAAH